MISIYETEDDQIVLNKNHAWIETLFASCPEQARCFYFAFKNIEYETIQEWEEALYNFQCGWEMTDKQDF